MFTDADADDERNRYEPEIALPQSGTPFAALIRGSAQKEPLYWVKDLRTTVEDMEYSTVFKLKRGLSHHDARAPKDQLIMLAGIWPIPPWFSGSRVGNCRQYINPHTDDASRYGDIGVYCPCGNVITHLTDDHAEGCPEKVREHADERLRERRITAARALLRYGYSLGHVATRLGFKTCASLHEMPFSVERERDVYRDKIAITTFERIAQGSIPLHEIASGLGHSPSTVGEWTRERFGEDAVNEHLLGGTPA